MDQDLRNAAAQGNVGALYSSIARDPTVLENIDVIPFVETPLHVAAAAGQIEFAREIIRLKPSFARKLNPEGFTPLFLAMRCNQDVLVLELVKVHEDLVLGQGRWGMNPLHCAAETGNLSLLTVFLRVSPKLGEEVTSRSETALHVALKNDKFDACLVLIGWLRRAWFRNAKLRQYRLLNWKDLDGNTVLHIASSKNEAQVVRQLLNCEVQVKIKNSVGCTPMDIVAENGQGASQKIKELLLSAEPLSYTPFSIARYLMSPIPFSERLFIWFLRQKMQISIDKGNMLLVVAVLLVTVSYQGVLSPPGGFWQDDSIPGYNSQLNSTHFAGTVTMGNFFFHGLFLFNSSTFYISLLLIALVIPPDLTSALLTTSLMVLFLSYGLSVSIITPLPHYWFCYYWFFFFFLVLNIVLYLRVTWKNNRVLGTFVEVENIAWHHVCTRMGEVNC